MIDNILYTTDFILDIKVVNTGTIVDTMYTGIFGGQLITVNSIHSGSSNSILFQQELLEYPTLEGGIREISYIF